MNETDRKKFNRICLIMRLLIYYVMALMLVFTGYTAVEYISAFFSYGKMIYPLMTIERVLDLIPPSVAAGFGAAAFRSMRRSETPFIYDVSKKIKAASMWIIIGEAVHSAYNIGMYLTGFADDWVIGSFRIITGIIMLSFVYVIEQGCRLQKESDETL